MNKIAIISFIILGLFLQGKMVSAQPLKSLGNEMCWWYEKPAAKYWEGLPIGTGRLAAMVLGKVAQDQLLLNEETLWAGSPNNPNSVDGPEKLAEMRKLIANKEYFKADSVSLAFSSQPMRVQHYQPMSNLNLKFDGVDESKVKNYRRKLSMDSALVTITYELEGVKYKREIFASYPDQVIVMKISSNKPRKINVTGWMNSLQPSAVSFVENNDLVMNGGTKELNQDTYAKRVIPSLMKWQSRVRILNDGGKISVAKADVDKNADAIKVENANAVTFIVSGATNWKSWDDISANEKARCLKYLTDAEKYSYQSLRKRHLDDYCPLFSACKLDLGGYEKGLINTSERMEQLRAGGTDPLFVAQYFQFSRYLMLAGAREGTLAFNNHNIWLNNMEGRWQGRWTLNINIQECYWPVENTNLPKINESLVYFTEQLAQAGARTAKEMYNCRGWVAHHGTDVWFNTAPTDCNPKASIWPMAGAWLLQQLYDHYLYEPDASYLKRIYPLMKGSAEFFLDFLIPDSASGWLVTSPSTSPENFFMYGGKKCQVSMGSSMDNQIVRNLFRNCISAGKILGIDADLQKQMGEALKKLPPHQIGKHGQLQEWIYDFEEFDVKHRHLSHLFATYPDDDISVFKTPELAKAVSTVLQRRSIDRLGWAGAWKINLHARLLEPEEAYKVLQIMLVDVSLHPYEEDSKITPSYEGNQAIQGVAAGVAEMLMQSHSGELFLLPALPAAWQKGSVNGLRARGGYTIDLSWENGKLKESVISAKISNKCRLRTKQPVKVLSGNKPVKITLLNGVLEFDAKAGAKYRVVPL